MRDSFNDSLNRMFGKKQNYTNKEIDRALAYKRKNGGTLLDALQTMTGRSLPDSSISSAVEREAFVKEIDDFTNRLNHEMNAAVEEVCEDSGMSAMSGHISEDSGISATSGHISDDIGMNAEAGHAGEDTGASVNTQTETELNDADKAALFTGITDELKKNVFGQDEFLRKLMIAFKRPFVMPGTGKRPANTIYITGRKSTGRHSALREMTQLLKDRGILTSSEIRTVDLSIYPSAGEERLFLQDIYSALNSTAKVILFENYENCHTSFLISLSDLVTTGSCRLAARYVMQNGQLVNVTNMLASETVSSLSAAGKYLVFISSRAVSKLADCFGAPFVNAVGDVCETTALTDDALKKIAEREFNELKETADKQFGFILSGEDSFIDYSVTKAGRQAGLDGILDFYGSLLKAFAQIKLEEDPAKGTEYLIFTDENAHVMVSEKTADGMATGKNIDILALLPGGYRGEIDEIRAEMDNIVGLKEIKDYVFGLEEYYRTQQRRREEGLKASEVSKHMIFTGSPGTGKTTIARIISKYLKAIGVLSGGQLVEVSRADLVGRYVGHTAPLTNQVIQSAIGGVLFIDEAYSLYRGKDDSFGLEAIDTLVKGIEDNRENLIVILAGYSNEMEEFLTSNSGLKSRFPNVINFPDYTGEELVSIAAINAASRGYTIDEGAKPSLLAYFNSVQAVRAADAGNGRLARNKIEEAVLNQSRRLVAEPESDLSLLTSKDFDLNDINGD